MHYDEIVAIISARRRRQTPVLRKMLEVKRRHDADWVLPMPNLDDEPVMENLGPALVADAVDYLGNKASTTYPRVYVPAVNPATSTGRGSVAWAEIRRRAYSALLFENKAKLHLRQCFYHRFGYATFSMLWMPDDELNMPRLVVRDPLSAFPEPMPPTEIRTPLNVGYVAVHTADELLRRWGVRKPELAQLFRAGRQGQNQQWDVVEWIDDENVVLGILGPHFEDLKTFETMQQSGSGRYMELARWDNKVGFVPGVSPQQVTMSGIASAIAKNIGQSDLIGKLTALDVIATEKAIFPDRYVVGKIGQTPTVVGGRWKDGREGETNIVLDATQVGILHNTPDPAGRQAADRAERNFRVSTGLIPQAGGETYGALRTGRGMDSLQEASVDPRVQAAHEEMEYALGVMCTAANHMLRGYWPNRKFVMFSGWPGDQGDVEFEPAKHMSESDRVVVAYPIAGTDVNGLSIRLLQELGAKTISRRTYRMKHPDIDNPEQEEKFALVEALQDAAIESLTQLVANGATPPEDLAQVGHSLLQTGDIFEALKLAGELAQRRQAAAAQPPGGEEMAEGEGGPLGLPPGSMPGLGPPGAGMEQQGGAPDPNQGAAIQPGPQSWVNLSRIVRELRAGAPR